MIALDASAVLAYMYMEPGSAVVREALLEGCLSTVNLVEVVGRFVRDGHPVEVVTARIDAVSVEIVEFDRRQAEVAASLIRDTRAAGLSLGDRACLALASIREIPALTADRAWGRLDLPVEVRLIR